MIAVGTAVSSVANPVLSVVNLVADGLPILGTSNPLDRLLGGDNHNHSVVGHRGDLTPVITGDIGSADPISALVGDSVAAFSVARVPHLLERYLTPLRRRHPAVDRAQICRSSWPFLIRLMSASL